MLENTSEISDFLSLWNPPDRALAAAGAPFLHIYLIAEKCSKLMTKSPLGSPGITKITENTKNDLREKHLRNDYEGILKNPQNMNLSQHGNGKRV